MQGNLSFFSLFHKIDKNEKIFEQIYLKTDETKIQMSENIAL